MRWAGTKLTILHRLFLFAPLSSLVHFRAQGCLARQCDCLRAAPCSPYVLWCMFPLVNASGGWSPLSLPPPVQVGVCVCPCLAMNKSNCNQLIMVAAAFFNCCFVALLVFFPLRFALFCLMHCVHHCLASAAHTVPQSSPTKDAYHNPVF